MPEGGTRATQRAVSKSFRPLMPPSCPEPLTVRCRTLFAAADGSIWRSNQELGRILGKLREVKALNIDTRDLISVTEASNRGVSRLIQDAAQGRTQVVLRNNKAVAAVVGIEAVERLGRLEELEDDLRLLSVALARTVTDSGRRYSLDEVAAELGVDLDSLVDED